MDNQDKIDKLREQIFYLEKQQSNCIHAWMEPRFDPETIKVQDDRNGYEEHGVDRWPRPSFHDEQKDRWSRKCIRCGFKEYTYNQKETVIKKEPNFG